MPTSWIADRVTARTIRFHSRKFRGSRDALGEE